jgi:hypothetical protein
LPVSYGPKPIHRIGPSPSLVLRPFATLDDATDAVLRGDAWGLAHMHANFSAALLERMFNSLEADATTRNQSKINVRNDFRVAMQDCQIFLGAK